MTSFHSIHLTERGLDRAATLFDDVSRQGLPAKIRPASPCEADWSDFDSVYLYLYRLTLLHRQAKKFKLPPPVPPISKSGMEVGKASSALMNVGFLIDVELADESNPRHLLSEFAVQALIEFRDAFTAAIPLASEVTDIDVGCVMMTFSVSPPNVEGKDKKDALSTARRFVERRLTSDAWIATSRRFSVKHQWIDETISF